MSLWKIAWRSIQQRALASTLTIISMALGVMLVVAVLVAHGVIDRSFKNNSDLGYNMVVGAKGGRIELVLNAVYYLARPIENIPYGYYQEFTSGRFSQHVERAIPVCLGDMYHDFRVVGTTPEFFDLEYAGQKYQFQKGGRNFKADEYFTGVIGATVARETGLKVGDDFQPAHGAAPDAHVHDPFKVVGILKPTGTPNDRALFINMEGFYRIPEHAEPDAAPGGEAEHHDEVDHDHEHGHADEMPADEMPADEEHAHEDGERHEHGDKHEHAEEHGHAHDKDAKPTADGDHEDAEQEHADADGKHADEDHADEKPADHDHEADAAHPDHEHADHEPRRRQASARRGSRRGPRAQRPRPCRPRRPRPCPRRARSPPRPRARSVGKAESNGRAGGFAQFAGDSV